MKKTLLTICAILLSASLIHAQETRENISKNKKQEKLFVKVKEGAKPDIYVDGKKFDFPMELIDQDKIESVSVIKDKQAIKSYNAPNGVVLIKTKKKAHLDKEASSDKPKIKSTGEEKSPLVIIDGKKSTKVFLEKLSPNDIEKIEVFKGEQAIEKYNAPNGGIIVTTKKEKK